MYYDPEKNAMFDIETGALIPLAEGDDIPQELRAEVRGTTNIHRQIQQRKDFAYAQSLQNGTDVVPDSAARRRAEQREQEQRDRAMAMELSLASSSSSSSKQLIPPARPLSSSASTTNNPIGCSTSSSVAVFVSPLGLDEHARRRQQEEDDRAFALSLSQGLDLAPPPSSQSSSSSSYRALLGGVLEVEQHEENPYYVGNSSPQELGAGGSEGAEQSGGWFDDLSLARALQAMEFEIASEMRQGGPELTAEEEEYNRKERKATKCKRQLVTISSFVCLVQIGLLVAMIQDDGYVSKSENPMYGPSAYTLVRYGAKVAALIKYEGEWWRLITPIFLHAGIIHIISNVAIQLRVGGYLELVFGRARWVFIYLSSGIYGNMLSCIFLPDSVGIGSSGAVLGMLTAWIVWILFRWSKVPAESRGQRTCQLIVVTAAVAFTLAFSFTDYVDWAAHFGGAIQGAIAAAMMLSGEVQHVHLKWGIRVAAAVAFVASYMWAVIYMLEIMHPDREYLALYDQNDDWGR